MKLLVLSTCDKFQTIDGVNSLLPDGQHRDLEKSLIKHGYDYEFWLYGFEFGKQYQTINIFVNQYKGDATHVLYCDMFDSVFFAPPKEIIAKFKTMQCKMLISCEKAYFPDDGQSELMPESETPYRFINGGGCLFEIEYFKQMVANNPFPNPMMDPHWLRDCFLNDRDNIKLDYHCEIFQTMSHHNKDEWSIIADNIIYNKATGFAPCIFHYNGIKDKREIQWMLDVADLES